MRRNGSSVWDADIFAFNKENQKIEEMARLYQGKSICIWKSEVLINQVSAAKCSYGYRSFCVHAGEHLNYGRENTITVIVDNLDMPNSRRYSGSGIYRPVWLCVKNKKQIRPNGVRW